MKLSQLELCAITGQAARLTPIGSLWRHKSGAIYEVLGHDIDAGDTEVRVRYSCRLHGSCDFLGMNPVTFSRPIAEWTVDRFVRLT